MLRIVPENALPSVLSRSLEPLQDRLEGPKLGASAAGTMPNRSRFRRIDEAVEEISLDAAALQTMQSPRASLAGSRRGVRARGAAHAKEFIPMEARERIAPRPRGPNCTARHGGRGVAAALQRDILRAKRPELSLLGLLRTCWKLFGFFLTPSYLVHVLGPNTS